MTIADTHRLRADDALDRARAENRSALIGYLPAGFPDLERSIEAARVLIDHGADMIELGLPYWTPSWTVP